MFSRLQKESVNYWTMDYYTFEKDIFYSFLVGFQSRVHIIVLHSPTMGRPCRAFSECRFVSGSVCQPKGNPWKLKVVKWIDIGKFIYNIY